MNLRQHFGIFCIVLILNLAGSLVTEEAKDTREGEDVTLECRFSPLSAGQDHPTFYWSRTNKQNKDSVAVHATPLDPNYRVDYRPEQGRYDLLIANASYDRDNGKFECRVKASGSGRNIHFQAFALTVLTPPGPPQISPGVNPTSTEGKTMELTCSSSGGSPDPVIKWYKEGNTYPLEAEMQPGNSRDSITRAVLTLTPARSDDGAAYRCVVWNRAMPEGSKLDARVTLNVNYFPRVEVGPENPLRVERDATANLQCTVDAKPKVNNVRWTRNGRFIATAFTHTIHRVTLEDAGKYMCTADNGLGQAGEAEILLDVLYPPMVTIEAGSGAANHREAEEGETLVVHCNVSANPTPITVEWLRDGHPGFRQTGSVLRIERVSSESAGSYTCRAVNILNPSSQPRRRMEKIGNASITILVRHKPGRARISPDKPVAAEGTGITLTCSANPPGWPAPQYRWWRDGDLTSGSSNSAPATVLATGQKYTIPSAHLGSEGKYHCQATNEMGHGDPAFVNLVVHQPPRFLAKLQPHVTRRVGDSEFSATCGAIGKPKPSIRWLKDGHEITVDPKLFDISTDESEGRNSVFTVQSTLRFLGHNRPEGNQLLPADRGLYSCAFENEVKKAESSMHLRIEHEPIVLHQYNKVAYDLKETAEVVCRVQAYPRPEFQWNYGTNSAPLLTSSEGHYELNTTAESGDIHTSILKISNIRDADYGEYTCRVANSLGTIRTGIHLQPKGPPEKPATIKATEVGHNYVTLLWEPGFDGGIQNTKFFVSYRRVLAAAGDEMMTSDCYGASGITPRRSNGEGWQEFDCQKNNPCNVTSLEQHHTYVFKVKAVNTKGHSNCSDEVVAVTKVDRIPAPQRVTFDPESHSLSVNVGATCLQLVALVEASMDDSDDLSSWRLVENIPITGGPTATRKEATIHSLVRRGGQQSSVGRSLGDDDGAGERPAMATRQSNPRVRVKLCLRAEQEHCSDYTDAEIGSSYIKEAAALTTPTLIAIIVSCVVFVLFAGLLFMFCRCKRNQHKKGSGKDYEMESTVRPSLVTQQPPPPYYPSSGLENKALEHSLDLAMDDPAKSPVYASQNGYGYHGNPPPQGPQGHNINGGEWVNMGYMDNSYSNSNNGTAGTPDHHHRPGVGGGQYGYDPLTHGGYGAVDDYAPYPHITSAPGDMDYQQRPPGGNAIPQRQDYGSDPYAAVHKPKKRMDQHLDSPYHDVSGLPDPYMDQLDCDDSKPQHISLSFDESLESGYSTPNSRSRRVIREIIV
ncbi:hemicentin-1 isoform X7 [Periplaneta americana]|uniref:hemicentin-1 isoform X7 n=1 Tax=Periplaneta americana TaxID=6978 RepID=UPI0037E717B2